MNTREGSAHGRMAKFVLPRVVYEIEPGFVVGARLDARSRQLRRMAVRELPPHTVEPFAHRANVENADDLRVALRGVAQVVGDGNTSRGLLIPDGAVRVAVLDFETLPESRKDAEALIRWRMRENLPAAPHEARISYQVLSKEPRHVELLVVAIRIAVLADYEQILEPMNGGLSLVLPATLALLPLIPVGSGAGELLLHICGGWMTTVVLHENRVKMWRCSDGRVESPGELARSAAVEAARVAESARDRLQIEMDKVWVIERPLVTEGLEEEMSRTLSKDVVRLTPLSSTAGALADSERPVFENFGGTLAGLISNLS
jgi:hypothetical protein